MPLDHINLQDQIHTFVKKEAVNHQQVEPQITRTLEVLGRFSKDIPGMKDAANNSKTRIAVPYTENPNAAFPPPSHAVPCNLVCTDGSQIYPDPNNEPVFALVNIGIITIPADSTQAVKPRIISKLYQREDLYKKNDLVSEDLVNLDRDVKEMESLQEACQELDLPAIALRDGLMELYHEPRVDNEFQEKLTAYQDCLKKMKSAKVIPAGYVDSPRSQMVVALLRLCSETEDKERKIDPSFLQIMDRQLFEQKLKSGERSAIFENYLPTRLDAGKYYFFYLNVSSNEKPYIVRVEIPQWVADDPEGVNLLHFTLLKQCTIMGSRPYPYCLYRAHETALVSQQEKDELGKHLRSKMPNTDTSYKGISAKQSAKNLSRLKKLEL